MIYMYDCMCEIFLDSCVLSLDRRWMPQRELDEISPPLLLLLGATLPPATDQRRGSGQYHSRYHPATAWSPIDAGSVIHV